MLTYLGLRSCVDDAGRFRWLPKEIEGSVFPFRDVPVRAFLEEFIQAGVVIRYAHGDQWFGYVLGWDVEGHPAFHPKKDRAKSRLPEPPAELLYEGADDAPEGVEETSRPSGEIPENPTPLTGEPGNGETGELENRETVTNVHAHVDEGAGEGARAHAHEETPAAQEAVAPVALEEPGKAAPEQGPVEVAPAASGGTAGSPTLGNSPSGSPLFATESDEISWRLQPDRLGDGEFEHLETALLTHVRAFAQLGHSKKQKLLTYLRAPVEWRMARLSHYASQPWVDNHPFFLVVRDLEAPRASKDWRSQATVLNGGGTATEPGAPPPPPQPTWRDWLPLQGGEAADMFVRRIADGERRKFPSLDVRSYVQLVYDKAHAAAERLGRPLDKLSPPARRGCEDNGRDAALEELWNDIEKLKAAQSAG